jgi:hypothetical protein
MGVGRRPQNTEKTRWTEAPLNAKLLLQVLRPKFLFEVSEMTDRFEPTHEQIEQRAYEIFVERGYEHGGDVGDWFAAEQQLRDRAFDEDLRNARDASKALRIQEQPDDSGLPLRKKATAVGFTVGTTSS